MESVYRLVWTLYLPALPALFLVRGFGALDGDVFFAVTGARALLVDCDFDFAAGFLTAAFLAGLAGVTSASAFASILMSGLAGFAAFLARRFAPPPLPTRSSSSALASGSVMVSGVLSLG